MRDTNEKNPTEFQAPTAPQPTGGQTAAQMWITSESGNKESLHNGCRLRLHQYQDGRCAGEWFWSCEVASNAAIKATGIEPTEEAAANCARYNADLPIDELITTASIRQLEAIREAANELAKIGHPYRANPHYALGYDDGYRAALAKMTNFLENEQPGGR